MGEEIAIFQWVWVILNKIVKFPISKEGERISSKQEKNKYLRLAFLFFKTAILKKREISFLKKGSVRILVKNENSFGKRVLLKKKEKLLWGMVFDSKGGNFVKKDEFNSKREFLEEYFI